MENQNENTTININIDKLIDKIIIITSPENSDKEIKSSVEEAVYNALNKLTSTKEYNLETPGSSSDKKDLS